MDPQLAETIALAKPALAAEKYFFKSATNLAFEFGAASDPGLCREVNEDHYIVVQRRRTQELLLSNVPQDEFVLPPDDAFGMAVADGMSGSIRGDLASRLAIRAAWELAGRTTSWIMKLAVLDPHELSERVEGFTYMMQKAFEEEVESNSQFADSGTTWTCAYLVSSFAVVANIGDSPCFLWRDGIMGRISNEHTVEQEFIEAGVRPEIAGKYRHMLTRCLGTTSRDARPDVHHLRLQPRDQLLLCTDGLTDLVSIDQIAHCLGHSPTAQNACNELIQLALAAGGKDNVTAVLARAQASLLPLDGS